MKIGLVAPVKPYHPYLEDGAAPLLDLHYLRISPWLWFSCLFPQGLRMLGASYNAFGGIDRASKELTGVNKNLTPSFIYGLMNSNTSDIIIIYIMSNQRASDLCRVMELPKHY